MTGLGDRVRLPSSAFAFLRCLPSGSSLGSRAALCRLLRLLPLALPPSTSSAPPSFDRHFLFLLLAFFSACRAWAATPLTESSMSDGPALEPLDWSRAGFVEP